jgi:hypothetical protein
VSLGKQIRAVFPNVSCAVDYRTYRGLWIARPWCICLSGSSESYSFFFLEWMTQIALDHWTPENFMFLMKPKSL